MRKYLIFILMGLFIIGITGCQDKTDRTDQTNQTDQAVSEKCDRQCLEGFVDRYLDAMVVHNAAKAPFAENARYTEKRSRNISCQCFRRNLDECDWID